MLGDIKMRAKLREAHDRLRNMLKDGRYLVGNRLPTERELADELSVSRSALRKILSILEAEGLIWRHVGRGTFLGPRPNPCIEAHTAITYSTSPPEIMEVRLMMEPKIAAMAAQRSTQYEIEKMDNCVRRCAEAPDFVTNERWDYLLHENFAMATHNSLITSLYGIINKLREGDVWGRLKEASMTSDLWKEYSNQHYEIVQAIRDRDPAKAEEAMRKHLETVKKHLLRSY